MTVNPVIEGSSQRQHILATGLVKSPMYIGPDNTGARSRVRPSPRHTMLMEVMRQTACSVVSQIMVNNFAALFNCTPAYWASDGLKLSINLEGIDTLSLVGTTVVNCWISVAPAFQCWSCCWVLILCHLSVESLLFWCIDGLEVFHAGRITCMQNLGWEFCTCKPGWSAAPIPSNLFLTVPMRCFCCGLF